MLPFTPLCDADRCYLALRKQTRLSMMDAGRA
jgi:hypothetical protein